MQRVLVQPPLARQRGSIALTTALAMFFLLGCMGLGLDFGRLFVLKGELQTAVDSCALAAAGELDQKADALTRAQNAGLGAGNSNAVDLQSATWGGKGGLVPADVTFLDSSYVATNAPAQARYARCGHRQSGVQLWLLQALGTASATGVQDVSAFAVATRASAQSTCPVPLGLKPRTGATAPRYGFVPGEWVKLLMAPGSAANGEIGWMNLDGSTNANETEDELKGFCGTRVKDHLGTPGVKATIADVWNARFGLYKNSGDPAVSRPDFTGYTYTTVNWPTGKDAYPNYAVKSLAFEACAGSVKECEDLTGLKLKGGFKDILASGPTGHGRYGASRRLVTVPVVDGSDNVINFVCMLMLQPLSIPMADVYLEFLDNAASPGSPCATSGLPGGSAGPLVPALVR